MMTRLQRIGRLTGLACCLLLAGVDPAPAGATLIIGFKGDLLFDRAELIQIKNAIPRATHLEIDSPWGHAACCGGDVEAAKIMGREIAAFLATLR